MFNNIGKKIKSLSKVICWIGIIISLVLGIVCFAVLEDLEVLFGFLVIFLGSLLSWLNTFILYAFGQLVDNSDILVVNTKKTQESGEEKCDSKKTTLSDKKNQLTRLKKQNLITDEEYSEKLKKLNEEENDPAYALKNSLLKLKEEGLITDEDYKKKLSEVNDDEEK